MRSLVLAALLLLSFCSLQSALALGTYGIYDSQASVSVEWNTSPFDTESLYKVEQGLQFYFLSLLQDTSHDAIDEATNLVSIAANARKQSFNADTGRVKVETLVRVTSNGYEGLQDLAGILLFLHDRNSTGSVFSRLDEMIGIEAEVVFLSVSNEGSPILAQQLNDPESQSDDGSDTALIVAVAILSSTLVFISVILCWITGGWFGLRKQIRVLLHREEERTRMTQNLELKKTMTDEEVGTPEKEEQTHMTNPSGILGVNPNYRSNLDVIAGLGVKMTPARGRDEFSENGMSEIATPMSAVTEYTHDGRVPLGITSMRKLLPQGDSVVRPDHPENHANSLVNFQKKLSYADDEEDVDNVFN